MTLTLSTVFVSVLSAISRPRPPVRDCAINRPCLGLVELVLPATALQDDVVARWVRDYGVAVEVRSGPDLAAAIAAGIDPIRVTAHAGGLTADELVLYATDLGVGRFVVGTAEHVAVLGAVGRPGQRVMLGCGSAASALHCPQLDLVGLYADVGPDGHSAVIGDLMAEMSRIRREYGVVLTRIALGGCGLTFGAGPGELSDVVTTIDETLDDACATLRFPRPVVALTAEPAGVVA